MIAAGSRRLRRRPPLTVVACIASVVVILILGLIIAGRDPRMLAVVIVLGAGAVGLYLGSRIAWILVTALVTVNLLVALSSEAALRSGPILGAMLALLLARPSRRYVRQGAAPEPARPTGARRVIRVGAIVSVGLLVGMFGIGLLLRPGPVAGDLKRVRSDQVGLRVLFVGNSLTSDNSMPAMVSRLAEGDRRAAPIFTVRYARRGSTLEDAADDARLSELLRDERWNHVVLQEHSLISSRPADRQARTLPAASALGLRARQSGAQTVLFSSWGYKDGDGRVESGDTRQAMEARISRGSLELASPLSASIAPVGRAWEEALRRLPELDLWRYDGRRPDRWGSYLTACVFYALLTHRDPTGSRFTAGLDLAQARWLQSIAWESVTRPG
jgi:hypothetical protein